MEEMSNTVMELQERISSHPVISTLWLMAIAKSMNRLDEDLDNARRALEAMHTESDITPEQLVMLSSVFGQGR